MAGSRTKRWLEEPRPPKSRPVKRRPGRGRAKTRIPRTRLAALALLVTSFLFTPALSAKPDPLSQMSNASGYGGEPATSWRDIPVPAVSFVTSVGGGFSVRTGGELDLPSGRREFVGTGDLQVALGAEFVQQFQLLATFRFGGGGLSLATYEDFYQTDLQTRHAWIGIMGRYYLLPRRASLLRPYVVAGYGGDRVAVVQLEGTGVYRCTSDGLFTTCDEQQETVFSTGYWAHSITAGAGLSLTMFESRKNYAALEFFLDGRFQQDLYTRLTHSELPNQTLEDPVSNQSVYVTFGVDFVL